MHDTFSFGYKDESRIRARRARARARGLTAGSKEPSAYKDVYNLEPDAKGLMRALEQLLEEKPDEWRLLENRPDSNGLAILERITDRGPGGLIDPPFDTVALVRSRKSQPQPAAGAGNAGPGPAPSSN